VREQLDDGESLDEGVVHGGAQDVWVICSS
jgi:hypothetical protein